MYVLTQEGFAAVMHHHRLQKLLHFFTKGQGGNVSMALMEHDLYRLALVVMSMFGKDLIDERHRIPDPEAPGVKEYLEELLDKGFIKPEEDVPAVDFED